jgi:hypothetical protein
MCASQDATGRAVRPNMKARAKRAATKQAVAIITARIGALRCHVRRVHSYLTIAPTMVVNPLGPRFK